MKPAISGHSVLWTSKYGIQLEQAYLLLGLCLADRDHLCGELDRRATSVGVGSIGNRAMRQENFLKILDAQAMSLARYSEKLRQFAGGDPGDVLLNLMGIGLMPAAITRLHPFLTGQEISPSEVDDIEKLRAIIYQARTITINFMTSEAAKAVFHDGGSATGSQNRIACQVIAAGVFYDATGCFRKVRSAGDVANMFVFRSARVVKPVLEIFDEAGLSLTAVMRALNNEEIRTIVKVDIDRRLKRLPDLRPVREIVALFDREGLSLTGLRRSLKRQAVLDALQHELARFEL